MNIQRLEYFLDLVETCNYTETAERLYTTQSNVSKQIIALEKELNIHLFDRSSRRIHLTDAGKKLIPYAKKMLADYAELKQALIPFTDTVGSKLRICAIPVMAQYHITELIAKFHLMHPLIQLQVSEMESIHLKNELDEGHCDIGYMRIFDLDTNKYEKLTHVKDRFVAVLPKTHPLSELKEVPLIKLKEESFLQLNEKTQLYEYACSLCRNVGFEPQIVYTGARIDNILDLVANGMGISIMMENAVKAMCHKGIVAIPLDIEMESELVFVRLKQEKYSKVAKLFWEYLGDLKKNDLI